MFSQAKGTGRQSSELRLKARFSTFAVVNLKGYLVARQKEVDRALDRFLPEGIDQAGHDSQGDALLAVRGRQTDAPDPLSRGRGSLRGQRSDAMPLACAVECIHTYSLIHDDLPAWTTTISAAASRLATRFLAKASPCWPATRCSRSRLRLPPRRKGGRATICATIVREIAVAAGCLQLIAGQVADLEGEGEANHPRATALHPRAQNLRAACASVRLGRDERQCTRRNWRR